MCNNTKAISFWNFLEENTIEIPIIQRDYAQGRLGKENLRKSFLTDLKNALDSGKTMKLDFVYGSTEKDKMNPLDGQQRLTTLWLLHWYIALRAGELSEDNCKIFRKFAYETRISSREFCQNLCVPEYFENFEGNDIVGFITKQTWFYSAWKQDPTIQSMLRMLGGTNKKKEDIVDGIEELFKCSSECFIDGKYCVFKRYWEKLTSDNAPVVFYHLSLKDFGLSDDLYIKMNARGKQLTSFENFKADLIGYITNQAENESLDGSVRSEWKKLLAPDNGIPIKLDTDWTDIFWKNKSIGITDKESKKRKSDQIDEIYFAFLNRFFWNELFIAKKTGNSEEYILDIGKGDESSTQENNNSSYKYLNNSERNNDSTIAYEGLDVYRYDNGTIPLLFFQKIKRVLDNYFAYSNYNNCLPECPWETSFRFIPIYEVNNDNNIEITNNTNDKILSVSTLNQVQRIVFFAVCKYFDHNDEVSDSETSLKQWMRVVWNLVSGEDQKGRPEIRSTSALRTAIKFIDSLESHKVYESLNNYDVNTLGDSSFDERCKEEIAKAKQILNTDYKSCENFGINEKQTWEEIIIKAENYAFFKGAIRFLFTDCNANISWCDFDTKWKNAQMYFDEGGVKDDNKVLLTKSLVIQCDNWSEQLYDKQIFKPNDKTWKWILIAKNWIAPIHNILMSSNISATKEKNDENVKNYVSPILEKLPFDYFINNEPNGRFHWLGERLCFYKPYGRDMATLDWGNWRRNEILSSLLKSNKITTNAQMGDSDFFWGWNVNFIYRGKYFQWYGNPNDKELDIYLMEEEWKDYKKRLNPTNNKGTEEDTHFCFRVDINTTLDTFVKKLDCLIVQAFPEESNKECCDYCQYKVCE